nr:MAG TPA: intron associated endonuclease [Caudoviricetes sp.]
MSLDGKNPELYCVYMHTNMVNGKKYIGITKHAPERRWHSDGGGYRKQIFWHAIQKYGWNNFSHELLATDVSQEKACRMEQEYIEKYKTTNTKFGYNISIGGNASAAGAKNTRCSIPVFQYDLNGNFIKSWPSISEVERTLKIPSSLVNECVSGKAFSAHGFQWKKKFENKIKPVKRTLSNDKPDKIYCYSNESGMLLYVFDSISEARKYLNFKSSASINKCVKNQAVSAFGFMWFDSFKGISINITEETKYIKTEIENNKNRRIKRESCCNYKKKVAQYDLNGNLLCEYNSVIDAGLKIGGNSKWTISKCCRGVRKTAYGYVWKYI